MIEGSPGLLGVLVRNLVDNAVRYSVAGGRVRVDVVADAANARLVVADDGPGVAPEQRRALGERFYRVPGSAQPGTGLGLSIVRRISELHRAGVAFDDGPGGRGLSVVVTFPASA
jgi:signal transduction histidine kinase